MQALPILMIYAIFTLLDPANDNMEYTPAVDISELIKHEEVMLHYELGPNGALVYCMEFLEANVKWLITKVLNLKDYYLIFDCPGQVHVHNSVIISCRGSQVSIL